MNIAEITTYREGGAYSHVAELVKGINENLLIITGNTKKTGYQQENGNTFFHIPIAFSVWTIYFINRPGSYKKLEELFKKHNIELVHFHGPLFTFCIGMIRKTKLPLIMTTHYILNFKGNRFISSVYNRFIKLLTLYIAKRVEKIICVNEEYTSILSGWGVEKEKLVFIPNGVDIKKFSPGKSNIKNSFKNNKVIIYFGRLHFQKNVHMLIRSFKYIRNKIDNVKLVIIGDGPDFNALKKMSAEYGDDVIMTGYLPKDEDLVDYLRGSDVAVFPSRGENASLAIMEAMACELPTISSDVGNARELLSHGRGIVLEQYTDEALAEQCIAILNDEERAKKMGRYAREYVKETKSWDVISKKTEEVYRTVLKKGKHAYTQ